MKKKSFAFAGVMLSALAMVVGTACSGDSGESQQIVIDGGYDTAEIKVTIWAADAVCQTFANQAKAYCDSSELDIGFRVMSVGEGDAASNMITDVEAGADIFCFAQDQMARLVQAGALSAVNDTYVETLKANNDATSVVAATVGNSMYAFPLTSDNGYFMYYDKSVFPDVDGEVNPKLENMTTVISTLKEAGNKKFYFELSSAWYNAAYFFGAGCKSEWTTNEDGDFVKYDDNYNSEAGRYALMSTYELTREANVYVASSDGASAFGSGAGVCVSGTWDVADVKAALGDNFGATDLPSVTDARGETYHLGSFSGCKLVGVKPQTDAVKAAACQALANYLTNEACQLERYNNHGWGPSNKNAQQDEAVLADVALSALNQQNQYATPQGQYPGDWWTLTGSLPASYRDGGTHDIAAATALMRSYETTIDSYTTV